MDPGAGGSRHVGSREFFSEALQGLIEYARHEAKLNERQKDGTTKRANLEVLTRDSRPGVRAQGLALLSGPDLPDEMEYLWGWFCEIAAGRGEGMSGVAPLTYVNIDAWSRLTDTAIAPHEVRAIFSLDAVTRHPELGEEPQ